MNRSNSSKRNKSERNASDKKQAENEVAIIKAKIKIVEDQHTYKKARIQRELDYIQQQEQIFARRHRELNSELEQRPTTPEQSTPSRNAISNQHYYTTYDGTISSKEEESEQSEKKQK